MTLHISFNGKDIAEYGLVALDGTLKAFMTPKTQKALVKNENSAMNGTMYITSPSSRKVKEGAMSIPFLMRSTSLPDQMRDIEKIRIALTAGSESSGVNAVRVAELDRTFYLIYNDIANHSNFGLDGYCLVTIKFIEPNPNNRKIG